MSKEVLYLSFNIESMPCDLCDKDQDVFICEGCEKVYCLQGCFTEHIKRVMEFNQHNQQMVFGYTPIECVAKAVPSLLAAMINDQRADSAKKRSQSSSSSSRV